MMFRLLSVAFAASALLTAPALAQSNKQELVAKVLQLQQPGIEAMARGMVEQPAGQLMQQVGNVIRQRVPADKREALLKDVQADLRKLVEDLTPVMRNSAVKHAPTTIGTLLEEKMTEDELREVIRMLESPVNRKYQALFPEMQRAITDKVVAETRATVQERLKALDQQVGQRLAPYAPATGAPKSN